MISDGLSATRAFIKQPSENRLYDMDFAANLRSGDSIASVVSVTSDQADDTLVIGAASISGSRIQFRLSGGVAGLTHKITAKVQTTLGDSLEGEGYVKVADL
jgi:hypothetical protein